MRNDTTKNVYKRWSWLSWGWASTAMVVLGVVATITLSYINGIALTQNTLGDLLQIDNTALLLAIGIVATISYIGFNISIYMPDALERRQARFRFFGLTSGETLEAGKKTYYERVLHQIERSGLDEDAQASMKSFVEAVHKDWIPTLSPHNSSEANEDTGENSENTSLVTENLDIGEEILRGLLREPRLINKGDYEKLREVAQRLGATEHELTNIACHDDTLNKHGYSPWFRFWGYSSYLPLYVTKLAYEQWLQKQAPNGANDTANAKTNPNPTLPTLDQHRRYNRLKAIGMFNALPNMVLVYAGGSATLWLLIVSLGITPSPELMITLQVAVAVTGFFISYLVTRKNISHTLNALMDEWQSSPDSSDNSEDINPSKKNNPNRLLYTAAIPIGLVSIIRMLWSFMVLAAAVHAGPEVNSLILAFGIVFALTTGLAGSSLCLNGLKRGSRALKEAWKILKEGQSIFKKTIITGALTLGTTLTGFGSLLAFALTYDLLTHMIGGLPLAAVLTLTTLISLVYLAVLLVIITGSIVSPLVMTTAGDGGAKGSENALASTAGDVIKHGNELDTDSSKAVSAETQSTSGPYFSRGNPGNNNRMSPQNGANPLAKEAKN